MSFNGSGLFLINSSGQPVVAGTFITDTVFNALTADLAAGLSNTVCKDGQTTVTANLPMAGFKLTGLGAGALAGESLRFEQRLQAKIGTFTRADLSVTGTQNVTGVGFTPAQVVFLQGPSFSIGFDNGTIHYSVASNTPVSTGTFFVSQQYSIYVTVSSGNIAQGEITAFGADGFTVTWSKTGSPTGTIAIAYLAFGRT